MPGLHTFIQARNQRNADAVSTKNDSGSKFNSNHQTIANLSRMPVPKMTLDGNGDPKSQPGSGPNSQMPSPARAPEKSKIEKATEEEEARDPHWDGFSTDLEDFTETSWSEENAHGQHAAGGRADTQRGLARQPGVGRELEGTNADYGDKSTKTQAQAVGYDEMDMSESDGSDIEGDDLREEDPTVTLNMDRERAFCSASSRLAQAHLTDGFTERPKPSTREPRGLTGVRSEGFGGNVFGYANVGNSLQNGKSLSLGADHGYTYPSVGRAMPNAGTSPSIIPPSFAGPRNGSRSNHPEDGLFNAHETYSSGQSVHGSQEKDQFQPHITHQTNGRIRSLPLSEYSSTSGGVSPDDLDFPPTNLQSMTYQDLKSQPFDHDPNAEPSPIPSNLSSTPLPARLSHIATLSPDSQSAFCNALTLSEWEETGDWFLEQFASMLTRMKGARREKRRVAAKFEEEIERREGLVQNKGRDIDEVLEGMKKGGMEVLSGNGR